MKGLVNFIFRIIKKLHFDNKFKYCRINKKRE